MAKKKKKKKNKDNKVNKLTVLESRNVLECHLMKSSGSRGDSTSYFRNLLQKLEKHIKMLRKCTYFIKYI